MFCSEAHIPTEQTMHWTCFRLPLCSISTGNPLVPGQLCSAAGAPCAIVLYSLYMMARAVCSADENATICWDPTMMQADYFDTHYFAWNTACNITAALTSKELKRKDRIGSWVQWLITWLEQSIMSSRRLNGLTSVNKIEANIKS